MTQEPTEGWRQWPRERLEREYSPSSVIPSLAIELEGYARASEAARRAAPPTVVSYGPRPSETFDWFRAPSGGLAPALIYIHGGYWQELSKRESAFMVPPLREQGVGVAVVDYQLAPAARLEAIVDQCAAASRHLLDQAAELGIDPRRVVVAGCSAGGHLSAMVLGRVDGLAGGILLSGVYDLRPLVGTYINDALGLDEGRAWAMSPFGRPMRAPVPLVVAVGDNEPSEFHRQNSEFAADRRAHGHPVAELRVAGRHHFDLPYDLGEVQSALGRVSAGLIHRGVLS
jgi:arylformamidase